MRWEISVIVVDVKSSGKHLSENLRIGEGLVDPSIMKNIRL